MTAFRIRILLVDDQPIVREGIAAVLAAHPLLEVVGQAGDGERAIALYRELSPDVSIVDLRMAPMDGAEITRAIRAENPKARVIVLTAYDTDAEVFRGLSAGAVSYVLKDVDTIQLVDTIQAVHAGKQVISPEIARKLQEHIAADALTRRQQEVLETLALGQSNMEIARTLGISEATVKAHVKAIFQKLGVRDRTQALTLALKRGLLRSA